MDKLQGYQELADLVYIEHNVKRDMTVYYNQYSLHIDDFLRCVINLDRGQAMIQLVHKIPEQDGLTEFFLSGMMYRILKETTNRGKEDNDI